MILACHFSWLRFGPRHGEERLTRRPSAMTMGQQVVVKGQAKHPSGSGCASHESWRSARRWAAN
jgi:hypothetical protein